MTGRDVGIRIVYVLLSTAIPKLIGLEIIYVGQMSFLSALTLSSFLFG
jgi:hypothetical protein